jgi:hypothetical protein
VFSTLFLKEEGYTSERVPALAALFFEGGLLFLKDYRTELVGVSSWRVNSLSFLNVLVAFF